MKSILKWALVVISLGGTNSFAGICHEIIGQNLKFNDKYPNANLTLNMGLQQITYNNLSAPIQVHCTYDNKISITWNSVELKGYIVGTVSQTAIGYNSYIFEVYDGKINDKKFPFHYLVTRIWGSGGH